MNSKGITNITEDLKKMLHEIIAVGKDAVISTHSEQGVNRLEDEVYLYIKMGRRKIYADLQRGWQLSLAIEAKTSKRNSSLNNKNCSS